jgi:glutathione S-transferase
MPMLRFTAERTTIDGAELAIGWDLAGRDQSALGLENAIAAVEDELARAHGSIAKGAAVLTDDATVRDIALAAGVPAGAEMTLSVEAVEQMFQRLAARAPGLPAGREFAGKLLILRELMHHLGFPSIVIRAA